MKLNEIINDKTLGNILNNVPVTSKGSKQERCFHDELNQSMVDSGRCKTLEEAAMTPRMLSCTCKKCKPFTY